MYRLLFYHHSHSLSQFRVDVPDGDIADCHKFVMPYANLSQFALQYTEAASTLDIEAFTISKAVLRYITESGALVTMSWLLYLLVFWY
jgi:hypothetical protein